LWLAAAASADASDKSRPVSKVIAFLRDMQSQLQKEAEDDEAIYDKMDCWCKSNDAEKTESIKTAENEIKRLVAEIEEQTALGAKLGVEIEHIKRDNKDNRNSLAEATAVREKVGAKYHKESKDLKDTISKLKNAIVVLKKHHSPDALVEVTKIMQEASILQHISAPQKHKIGAFLQAPGNDSAEIFGILGSMLENFESDLKSMNGQEKRQAKDFAELRSAKSEEIQLGEEQFDVKELAKAAADKRVADASTDLEDTRESLSSDEQFLMDLKQKCRAGDEEWESRQKLRNEELVGVAKAIKVLNEDSNHDLFTKTFNFIQLSASSDGQGRREAAAQVLARVNKPALSVLATQAKLDPFPRVKQAIDKMIEEIKAEQKEEVKHRDFCIEEMNKNELHNDNKNHEKTNQEAALATLTSQIGQLEGEIKELKSEVVESLSQIKKAGANRQAENAQFRENVIDQRNTQEVLKKAIQILAEVYGKKSEAFIQEPENFDSYKQNKGGNSVIAMLKQIAHDTESMEQEATMTERNAQSMYEKMVKEMNRSINTKQASVDDKTDRKASLKKEFVGLKQEHSHTKAELVQIANELEALHTSCDFTIKNFELRQTARNEEVGALNEAKQILSGAKFNNFLQKVQ
jgi:chromosome segregation ATPase